MGESVRAEKRGAVWWVVIDRPERRNALDGSVAQGIIDGVDAAENDPECRAIVLTGAGDRAFCAGGDLKRDAAGAVFKVDASDPRHFVVRLFKRIGSCNLPLIARVNGHALAGGLGLVCACDLAVASSAARFGTPEAKLGLFPMMILPYMLRVLPVRHLLELCITGEPVSAEEAKQMGLLNYVAPPAELDAKLDWLLARIVGNAPTSFRLGKLAFHAMRDMTLNESLEYAQLMISLMSQTQDSVEGANAFFEKRPPVWTGR